VIGGGLAGLTAGLFSARCGRSTLVVEASMPGGHLVNVEQIEDYPGFAQGIAGYDLCPTVQEQAANAGAEFALSEVSAVRPAAAGFEVDSGEGLVRARSVIVAVGSRPKALGIPGEEEFIGRGVSHCATCDGPLFGGKRVAVVGGGDSALQEALTLAKFAEHVAVLQRGPELTAQHVYRERAAATPAIEVRFGCAVEEIVGEQVVSGLRVLDLASGETSRLELAGVFPYVGLEPNTAFLAEVVPLDGAGHIATDVWMRTAVPGLFAAGDVRQDSAAQAVTAAGDGATAALAAHRYLADGAWR
jgi:thioredoxin reductase (NADPH)